MAVNLGRRAAPIGIAGFCGKFVETGSSTSARFGANKPWFGAPYPTLVRFLALEVVDDLSSDVRAIALARWALERDEP
jgi:hypothetical protein